MGRTFKKVKKAFSDDGTVSTASLSKRLFKNGSSGKVSQIGKPNLPKEFKDFNRFDPRNQSKYKQPLKG